MSLRGGCEVTASTETRTLPHTDPNLHKVEIFLDCDLKTLPLFNASDGFPQFAFINVSTSDPLFCPGTPKEGENLQLMKICAKETTDVAI